MSEGQANEQPIENRFMALLQSERGEQAAPEQEDPEPQEAEPEETEATESDEEQPEEESKPEQVVKYRFKVKTEDGQDEEVEMTPEEMQKGVMLERDYRRKTSEVAKQREQVQTEIQRGIEEERTRYAENLDLVQKALIKSVAPEFEGVDMARLADEDPARYVKLSNRMSQVQNVLAAIQQEQQRITEQQRAEHQQALAKQVSEARETLQRDVKGWNDDLYSEILQSTMKTYGFKPEEVTQVVDPRIVKLMHDAHQFQRLKSSTPIAEKKVAQAPKTLKPAQGTSSKDDRTVKLRTNLRKTGSIDSAAELFKAKFFSR